MIGYSLGRIETCFAPSTWKTHLKSRLWWRAILKPITFASVITCEALARNPNPKPITFASVITCEALARNPNPKPITFASVITCEALARGHLLGLHRLLCPPGHRVDALRCELGCYPRGHLVHRALALKPACDVHVGCLFEEGWPHGTLASLEPQQTHGLHTLLSPSQTCPC